MYSENDESQKGTINVRDLKSIGKGFLITVGGAAAAYGVVVLTSMDWSLFGKYAPIATVVGSLLINILRKFNNGPKY